jgi:hypothetical protein
MMKKRVKIKYIIECQKKSSRSSSEDNKLSKRLSKLYKKI